MSTMRRRRTIAVSLNTHKHEHLARALDGVGQLVGGLEIWTNLAGYLEFAEWLAASPSNG
jgi:hypothetical protein